MTSRLARSAGLISVATMGSRLLGVGREVVIAAMFGASAPMDAYNVAFRIPNLLRDLFAEGAMIAAFVPTFTRTLTQQGREMAWRLGSLVINALVIVTGVFVIVAIIFADPITRLLAPEFGRIPGKLELTTQLTRIMLPFLPLVAVAVAAMGMLNAMGRFFIPALSPAMFNVATIVCVLGLAPLMPRLGLEPIVALAIGTLLGGFGQILLQWPVLRKEGFRYRPVVDFGDPELRQVLTLMLPSTIALGAVQINVLVNTYLASSEPGAVSWLGYAFRLMYLPIGLFGVSIATAALPDISRHAVIDDLTAIRRTVSRGIRLMLMLNVPATLGLIALAPSIVSVLYERSRFTATDTLATAGALICYAPGLIGYSTVKIVSPTFYSLRDSRTPVVVSVISVALNLCLNLALRAVLGYRGLALGTALAAMFNAGTLLWLLRNRLGGIEGRPLAAATMKILLASIVMAAAAYLTSRWLEGVLPGASEPVRILRLLLSIAAGVVMLVAAAKGLRIEEFEEALRRVLRRAGFDGSR